MTQHTALLSGNYSYVYYLTSPAVSSGTITVTISAARHVKGGSISYIGADEANPIVNLTTNTGTTAADATTTNISIDAQTIFQDNLLVVCNLQTDPTITADDVVRQDLTTFKLWNSTRSANNPENIVFGKYGTGKVINTPLTITVGSNLNWSLIAFTVKSTGGLRPNFKGPNYIYGVKKRYPPGHNPRRYKIG